MFLPNLIQGIFNMGEKEIQFQNIWQIKTIKFDMDPDQQTKKFQKYLQVSYHVQDIKGNPGIRGHFFLTNLRIIWQAANDRFINLSFGIDTITLVNIKTIPIHGGSQFKHLLVVKCQNLNQTRYQFKFVGFKQTQLKIFNKISQVHKKALQTKKYRNVNLSLKCQPNFVPLQQQQVKSEYNDCIFLQNNQKNHCRILLSNIRIIIIRNQPRTLNYGIPWIMVKSFQLIQDQDKQFIHLCVRGHLSRKKLMIRAKKGDQQKKIYQQFKSFGQTFNKNPIFALDTSQIKQIQNLPPPSQEQDEIQQIVETKINLKKKKNAYSTQQKKGNLQSTQYNEQLGLMMEKLPQGITRSDLWQLLRD